MATEKKGIFLSKYGKLIISYFLTVNGGTSRFYRGVDGVRNRVDVILKERVD